MDKTHITLIQPTSPFLINQAVFPPLGIMYLSAFLKQYYFNVQCLDLGIGGNPFDAEADVVGVSFTTPQRESAYNLLDLFKKEGKIVIAGGPHPTHMEKECLGAGFDHVIKGYGENKLLQLLGELYPNHYVGGNLHLEKLSMIDSIPFPDRDALPINKYDYKIDGEPATTLMTSRGCPYNCSFCAKIQTCYYLQSAERTLAEIDYICRRHNYHSFMIFDDTFISNEKRLRILSRKLEGKYRFRCFARSDLITNYSCFYLKRMGVVEVGLGVESGSNKVLASNMKRTTREINLQAVQLLKEFDIRVKAFLIVGLPGETKQTIRETADWVEEAKPNDIDVSIFQPMPGSRIFKHPEKFGIKFEYNGVPGWYKGTPGKYETTVKSKHLTPGDLISYRDLLEGLYKQENLLR